MGIGGMVDDQLGNDAQPTAMGFRDEQFEVLAGAVLRVDVVIIGDVVAVILTRRWVERQQPDGVDPEILDVIQLSGETGEVTNAVIITIEERAYVYLVDDRVFVPKRIARRLRIDLCVHLFPRSRLLQEVIEVLFGPDTSPDPEDVRGRASWIE